MSESKSLAESTRSAWESLGFFYDYDESSRTWVVRAHRRGMDRLCEELRRYASDPRNADISEHEHYGPYSYLKFVTWTEPKVVADGIYGRVEDFDRLAQLIARAIVSARPGDRIRIDEAYAAANEAKLNLVLEPDSFDVASADQSLGPRTG